MQITKDKKDDTDIYNLYKPLRNHLGKLALDDSFYVIWSYIQHYQFNNKFPQDIEVALEFLNQDHIQKIRMCSEWELEIITREIIINAQNSTFSDKSLKTLSYFSGSINKLKNIENEIGGMFVNKDNILVELFRISHRQFPWQIRPNGEYLTRYYKIFSQEPLDKILVETIGLSAKELYLSGMLFVGAYLKSPAINLPINIQVSAIKNKEVERFIKIFSLDINLLREKIKNEVQYNDKFVYSFSSFRSFPIIKMIYRQKESLVCPMPTLLFWQITDGIYYKILEEIKKIKDEKKRKEILGNFGNFLGKQFQNYAGEVLKKSIKNVSFKVFKEQEYKEGKNRKDTADWMLTDNNAMLFIECKTKRMNLPAKIELNDDSFIKAELDKMADFIKQVYKSIDDYKNNKYPNIKYDRSKKIFPVILTLEQWYLFGDKFLNELDVILKNKIKENNLDEKYLEIYPYSICSIEEFEKMTQIINKIGIDSFMSKKFDQDRRLWAFQSFMNNDFKKEYKETKVLFDDDYKNIFKEVLEKN